MGTIINRHVLEATARMDIEVEFLDMIRQSGYKAEVAYVRVSDGTADAKIAKQLAIEEGTPVIRIARLCTADGRPAIYCEDVMDKSLVKGNYTIKDLKLPIFHFLQQFCGIYPYLDLTDLKPITADAALAETLQISIGALCCTWTRWISTSTASRCSVPRSILRTGSSGTPSCAKSCKEDFPI